MRLALYQPEIAPNVGASIRITACFDTALDIIEPCGFPLKDKEIRKVALDYGALVTPRYHASWQAFLASESRHSGRLILLSTKAETSIHDFSFLPSDICLIGQESAGVPDEVRSECDAITCIPLSIGARSLNMSVAAAITLAEARRQTGYGPRL